jgi:hypothetical protein
MSQFDADALERAAKAARELEKSRNVSAIMEMSKREQSVKKAEEERKKAEAEKERAAYQNQQERIRWEEQRKTMKQKQQEQMVRAECRESQKPHTLECSAPFVRSTATAMTVAVELLRISILNALCISWVALLVAWCYCPAVQPRRI